MFKGGRKAAPRSRSEIKVCWKARDSPERSEYKSNWTRLKTPFVLFHCFSSSLLPPLSHTSLAFLFGKRINACSYHFRTFSIAAMTRLMSSLALLRVSARTDLPDITALGKNIFFSASPAVVDTMRNAQKRGGGLCACAKHSNSVPFKQEMLEKRLMFTKGKKPTLSHTHICFQISKTKTTSY